MVSIGTEMHLALFHSSTSFQANGKCQSDCSMWSKIDDSRGLIGMKIRRLALAISALLMNSLASETMTHRSSTCKDAAESCCTFLTRSRRFLELQALQFKAKKPPNRHYSAKPISTSG